MSVNENWQRYEGSSKPTLSSLVGSVKAGVISSIRESLTGIWESIAGNYKKLRPVYKVMITTPIGIREIEPYRTILADTSRPFVNYHGRSDSPVLGIWVDQSDLTEPDKAIVLLQNPLVLTSGGVLEQEITNFPQYGVRNWLDIWMGYTPALTGVGYFTSLAEVLGSAAGINLPERLSRYNISFTLPDPFMFGNESHVFSGPIVSVKRDISGAGDRLQIIGFSPAMTLKQVINEKVNIPAGTSVYKAVEDTMSAVKPYNYDLSHDDEKFCMGRFPWYMFTGDYNENGPFRVVPVYKPPTDIGEEIIPLWTEIWGDHDDVEGKMREKVLRVGIKGKFTLYDLLFDVLDEAALYGGGGLYATILPNQGGGITWSFTDGVGHPGVFVKYGYKFEISGILGQIKNNRYRSQMKQTLTLGVNAREFEGGLEYGSVFNNREFMVRESDMPRAEPLVCPTDPRFAIHIPNYVVPEAMVALGMNPYEKESELWATLRKDIYIFGSALHPTRSWLWGKDNQPVDLGDDGIADYVARKMRETYFTGMSGSVFSIGDPSFKPGRVLGVVNARTKLATAVEDRVVNKISAFLKDKITSSQFSSPKMFKMKNFEKNFYIWKVRHYLGVKSGYVSKIYYAEERNRSWQKYTESIDSIIRQAFVQARQLMGSRSGER